MTGARGFRYDATKAPDPGTWLAIDEATRVELVASYLRRRDPNATNLHMRAALWSVVENQLALKVPAVVATFTRLTDEGLARPLIVSAVSMELVLHMQDLQAERVTDADAAYAARLAGITAAGIIGRAP